MSAMNLAPLVIAFAATLSAADTARPDGTPILYKRIEIPAALRTNRDGLEFGGDIRLGDLNGDGVADFLVYRSVDNAHDGGGMKPCFMAAFTMDGDILWRVGEGGEQPCRPGPVAIHDMDGDGAADVLCFFHDPDVTAAPTSMANVVLQIRDGRTGTVDQQTAPAELRACDGKGPNWAHQRLLIANFRGTDRPRDAVVKLGSEVIAFDEDLAVLWTHSIRWNEYGHCSAYIPSVGDIDGNGKDEVNGGYYLLDDDGAPLWARQLGNHMDSVAIVPWDKGHTRAICSGIGHVMDEAGNVVLRLGEERVPHGQEVRVARFDDGDPEPQMVIRWNAHTVDAIVVNTQGAVVNDFKLNPSPNNTGMEVVYWNGPDKAARLVNHSMLWDPLKGTSVAFTDLPEAVGPHRAGWYHCIPADVCGDAREEVVLYNPWDAAISIYTAAPLDEAAYTGYAPGPRQYNARLMD